MTIGGTGPGHGRRRPREHRLAAAVGRRAGHRPRRRGDLSGGVGRDRLRGGRRADRSRARRADRRLARRRGHRPAAGEGRSGHARAPVRGARRGAARAQGPVPRRRARGQAPPGHAGRAGRHRQEQARLGAREVPRRRASRRSCGTRAVRPPTGRESATGRSPRWSAGGRGSPSPTMPTPSGAGSARCSTRWSRIPPSARGSSRG